MISVSLNGVLTQLFLRNCQPPYHKMKLKGFPPKKLLVTMATKFIY